MCGDANHECNKHVRKPHPHLRPLRSKLGVSDSAGHYLNLSEFFLGSLSTELGGIYSGFLLIKKTLSEPVDNVEMRRELSVPPSKMTQIQLVHPTNMMGL
jgi:hypothetical protein